MPFDAKTISSDDRALILRTVFSGANPDELALFLHDCERHGIHPLDHFLHPQVRVSKTNGKRTYTVITSIDLMRAKADSTGFYAGNDDPVFDKTEADNPRATVTVYKLVMGQRCAFSASARWLEYLPDAPSDRMWKRMPHLMLGKVAEALALRKAFPAELSGLYAREEMQQAGEPEQAAPPRNEPPAAPQPTDPAGMERVKEAGLYLRSLGSGVDNDGNDLPDGSPRRLALMGTILGRTLRPADVKALTIADCDKIMAWKPEQDGGAP